MLRIFLSSSILTIVACSGALSTRITEVDGRWGGENAGLIVDNTAVHVHIGCTLGDAIGPIRPDADGSFETAGTYNVDAYPVDRGITHPARFAGRITGETMTLTVTLTDTNQVLGPVTLIYGKEPKNGSVPHLQTTPIREAQMAIDIKTSGVHHISLRVSDLERSKKFYCDTLGFKHLMDADNISLFLAGGTAFGLRGPTADMPKGDKFNPHRLGMDHIALACTDASELRRVADALSAAGIENTGAKRDETLGKDYVAFKDPDRIAWEFYMA